jgi:hypothetical protein
MVMPPDAHALLEALHAAAAGEFRPWFYRVKVSPRKWKRYRMPGVASRVSPKEALAMQAFRWLEGCSTSEIARRFHRKRETVRKALSNPTAAATLLYRMFGGTVRFHRRLSATTDGRTNFLRSCGYGTVSPSARPLRISQKFSR